MDEFIGIVQLFAGNFAPNGWAFCDGSLLQVNQNQALFSILGTTYGGDGQTTFALPDLRGRMAVGFGSGPNLTPRVLGQKGGAEAVVLTTQQLPTHTHGLSVSTAEGTTNNPSGAVIAQVTSIGGDGNPSTVTAYGPTANAQAAPTAISASGSSQPVGIESPFVAMNYIICLQGMYPSRS